MGGSASSWIARYCLAIVVPVVSVLALSSVGPRVTPLLCLFAAAAGVAMMAVIDVSFNGRYMLANRAEAKRRRRAEDRPPDA
jgi:hypothetical protein